MVAYFELDKTPTRWDLIDTKGRATVLYFLPGLGWGSEAMANDFYGGVNSWDGDDQVGWYNTYAYQAHNVIDLIKGFAFEDRTGEYSNLPAYETYSQPFKLYGFVFVPSGTPDPRSQEIMPDPVEPDDAQESGGGSAIWEDLEDEATDDGNLLPAETGGEGMHPAVRWGLVGTGALAVAGIAWWFLGKR